MTVSKVFILFLGLWCFIVSAYALDLPQDNELHNPFQIEQKIETALLPLHYANATNIAKIIQQKSSGLISSQGHVSVIKRSNSLWLQDSPAKIRAIKRFISKIDQPVQQVVISAQIVNVDKNFTRELGVKFGTTLNNATTDSDGLNMDLPFRASGAGHFGLAIAKLGNGVLLNMELSALESEGHGKVISRPKLITVNREPAYIESGEEVPYQERTAEGNTDVAFKKAVLSLKVTPEIVSRHKLLLHISVNQDSVSALMVNGVPAIQTRAIKTQVLVRNKQTLVLGGIYEQSHSNAVVRIPFLGSIPVIGALFRNRLIKTARKELLIFITPQIVTT